MGFFDDFSDIFADITELGDELRGLKDEIISSVIQPGQELKDTVTDIASTVTSDVSSATASVKQAVSQVTHIKVTDVSDVVNKLTN